MRPRRACACSRSHPKASGNGNCAPPCGCTESCPRPARAERALGDPKNTRRLASRDTLVIRHRPFRLCKQKLPNAPVVVRRQRDTRAVHPLQERSGTPPAERRALDLVLWTLPPIIMVIATTSICFHHAANGHNGQYVDRDNLDCFQVHRGHLDRYFSFFGESSSPSAIAVSEVLPFQ